MHIPTPHLVSKREKRKASVEHTEVPVPKKTTKSTKDPKPKRPKKPKKPKKLKAQSQPPEGPHSQPPSRSTSPNHNMSSPTTLQKSYANHIPLNLYSRGNTNSLTGQQPSLSHSRQPKAHDAALASRTPCKAFPTRGTNVDPISSASMALSCHWNIRAPKRTM
jgi:hypothetical protein